MKKFKFTIICTALALLATFSTFAQIKINSLKLPSIPGFELLKCDFHMHTVFSDGMVWPTVRVTEAFQEGLDAIALTDHIEYRPKLADFTSKDHLRSFEVAQKTAEEHGIILIKGTEITRRMAPGHFNAIFIKDANIFETYVNTADTRDGSNIAETLAEAKKQGAFVFWNHPWFQHIENRSEWQKIHQELYAKELISGIEIVNGERYDSLVFKWCLDKNLTVLSNSDIHAPMVLTHGQYRPMTIVLAKERSEKGIQEALTNQRTIAYLNNNLYGKKEWIIPIIEKSLIIKARQTNEKSALLEIENISGLPYMMELTDKSEVSLQLRSALSNFTIDALSQSVIKVNANNLVMGKEYGIPVKVTNLHVESGKPLEYIIKFKI